MSLHICGQVTGWMSGGVKQISWANYLFPGVNKTDPMTRLAPRTDEEIIERIDASTSSYTTESYEDTFKPDAIFEIFHYQAKVPMSDWALLAGFLMLWLKRCVVLTLPHEVIIIDVVYPTVLLAHRKSIALLPTMLARIQSRLRALTKASVRWRQSWTQRATQSRIPMVIPWLRLPVPGSSFHTHI